MGRVEERGRFRPGFVFKDGKAYEFERNRLTVMRPWPAPAAWRLTARASAFRHVIPRLDLASIEAWARPGFVEETIDSILAYGSSLPVPDPERVERLRYGFGARQDAARAFLGAIPDPVLGITRKFGRTQWQMLTFLGRVPGGVELATTNPVLAWALALNPTFHRPRVQQPLRAARTWVNKPRRQIAGWLGFPPSESSVHLLAKVEPGAAAVVPIFTLRRILRDRDPHLETLRHLPRINAAALAAVGRTALRQLVTGPFVAELAGMDEVAAGEALSRLHDTRRIARWLGEDGVRVRSSAHLSRVHDELTVRLNELPDRTSRPFPPPPIPGNASIEPITNSGDLQREGREMGHCVASFVDWVAGGQGYIYRVLEPERATLSIQPAEAGGWKIDQLKYSHNRAVEPETVAAVERWLAGLPEPPLEPPFNPTPIFPEFVEPQPQLQLQRSA